MPNGKKDIMAQAVYLAQLSAAKGKCTCNTCRILRKATEGMTADFLAEAPANPGAALDPTLTPLPAEAEEE